MGEWQTQGAAQLTAAAEAPPKPKPVTGAEATLAPAMAQAASPTEGETWADGKTQGAAPLTAAAEAPPEPKPVAGGGGDARARNGAGSVAQ